MEVWIVQWDYAYDNEHNVSVWATEAAALRHVCDDIEDNITNNWDMDDETQSQCADEISQLLAKGKHRMVMGAWNDYESNNNDEQATYWTVHKMDVQVGDDEEIITSAPVVAYKAIASGATCRGPCGQYNNYAYADRSDGTNVCYQCSTFQHIFGVKS
jgi:hypothetical protein